VVPEPHHKEGPGSLVSLPKPALQHLPSAVSCHQLLLEASLLPTREAGKRERGKLQGGREVGAAGKRERGRQSEQPNLRAAQLGTTCLIVSNTLTAGLVADSQPGFDSLRVTWAFPAALNQ